MYLHTAALAGTACDNPIYIYVCVTYLSICIYLSIYVFIYSCARRYGMRQSHIDISIYLSICI